MVESYENEETSIKYWIYITIIMKTHSNSFLGLITFYQK